MSAVPGKNTSSLRLLAVKLARNCFFGDDILALSSPSGKGGKGNLQKLDAGGLNHIKGSSGSGSGIRLISNLKRFGHIA